MFRWSSAEGIEKWNTDKIIEFLEGQGLDLNDTHFKILRKQEIKGSEFLDLSQEELERWGIPGGPAKRLATFARMRRRSSFVNQAALMVSKSESIIYQMQSKYPNLSELLTYNRESTVGFLKANGGLFAFSLSKDFHVPHEGTDNNKAWRDYRSAIEEYLEDVCENVKAENPDAERSFKEELKQARKVLSDEIRDKHYERFPYWPSVKDEQTSLVELDTGDIYDTGAYTVIWSCIGWIKVTDKRPQHYKYIAEFCGRPSMKLLVLDHDKLLELENLIEIEGIEKAKILIGSSGLTWDQLK